MRVTLKADAHTHLAADQVRGALLDFTERRLELWPTLDPDTYEVHWTGESSAEVTEGSPRPRVWSREHYDWSSPTTISWTAVESNFCEPGSSVSMELTPSADGGCDVSVTWDRSPANWRGRLVLGVIALGGHRLLGVATRKALADLAARL